MIIDRSLKISGLILFYWQQLRPRALCSTRHRDGGFGSVTHCAFLMQIDHTHLTSVISRLERASPLARMAICKNDTRRVM